jgi:preprotein translocase subunit YajC
VLAHHVANALLAASTGSKKSGGGLSVLFLPAILVIGFLLFTRSQRAKQRRSADQRGAIEPGVEVVTTAGLIARVVEMDDETVTLEIAPGVHSRFLRQAVVRTVEEPQPDEVAPEDTAHPADPHPAGDDGTPESTPSG